MSRSGPPMLNPANAITCARALAAPFIVLLATSAEGPSLGAAVLFLVAAGSDALDGYVARSRGLITPLGTLLDPFVDKLLVCSALGALALSGRVGIWVVVVVVAREVGVTWMRNVARRRGFVLGSLPMGKAKMALQCVTVVVLLVVPSPGAAWVDALVLAMIAATLASWLDCALALRRGPDAPLSTEPRTAVGA